MDIAGAILEPEDVPGLGHVGDQRGVARILPMMGVEAAERPPHGRPRADDRAIHVNRQAWELESGQRLRHEVPVERDERGQRLLRELPHPVGHGATRGQPRQAAEARDQRIATEIAPVLQPSGADVEPRQQHQDDPVTAVVAPQPRARLAPPRAQVDPAQIAAEPLQAAVRGERLGHELDREIALDHPSHAREAQTHQRGLRCARECMAVLSRLIALEASLIHVPRTFTSRLFADWG